MGSVPLLLYIAFAAPLRIGLGPVAKYSSPCCLNYTRRTDLYALISKAAGELLRSGPVLHMSHPQLKNHLLLRVSSGYGAGYA